MIQGTHRNHPASPAILVLSLVELLKFGPRLGYLLGGRDLVLGNEDVQLLLQSHANELGENGRCNGQKVLEECRGAS